MLYLISEEDIDGIDPLGLVDNLDYVEEKILKLRKGETSRRIIQTKKYPKETDITVEVQCIGDGRFYSYTSKYTVTKFKLNEDLW